jgi:hypothetical protein
VDRVDGSGALDSQPIERVTVWIIQRWLLPTIRFTAVSIERCSLAQVTLTAVVCGMVMWSLQRLADVDLAWAC